MLKVSDALEHVRIDKTPIPVRDQVADALRDAIVELRLKPGQRLVERELIQAFDVSRASVREALNQLASEGLVTMVPRKGAQVSAPTLDDAEDLYGVRAAIESLLIRRFVQRASEETMSRLDETVELMRASRAEDADARAFLKVKDLFYDVLMDGAESEPLRQLLESIQTRVRMLRMTSLSTQNRLDNVLREMEEIVAAARARNADRAARLLQEHIETAARLALTNLRSEQGALSDSPDTPPPHND